MQASRNAPLFALAMALCACGGTGPVAEEAENAAGLPAPPDVQTTDPTGAAPPANAPSAPERSQGARAQASASIPAAFHGRWGLTPADCAPGGGSARGVLVISPDAMQFYESRAVPTTNVGSTGDSFSADFAFRGEGMDWSKFQTLRLQGESLVRTESNPMASFTYAKCS